MQLSIHIIDCEDSFLTRVMGINNFVEYHHTSLILLPIDYKDLFYTYVMGTNNLLLNSTILPCIYSDLRYFQRRDSSSNEGTALKEIGAMWLLLTLRRRKYPPNKSRVELSST